MGIFSRYIYAATLLVAEDNFKCFDTQAEDDFKSFDPQVVLKPPIRHFLYRTFPLHTKSGRGKETRTKIGPCQGMYFDHPLSEGFLATYTHSRDSIIQMSLIFPYFQMYPIFPARVVASTRYSSSLENYSSCAGEFSAINAIDTQLRKPDKLGTDPMAVDGIRLDAVAESGRNPASKHQIQPECGNEQADAGRDDRTCLARPDSQARTGTGEYSFFLFSSPRAGLTTLPS